MTKNPVIDSFTCFQRAVKIFLLKRQKDFIDGLSDYCVGDKAFGLMTSYLLDVCSRVVELFDVKNTKIEPKRYLLEFMIKRLNL